ncbi:unnamed protein product [Coregonus sp. 'balchen']|nr:unnamed protein product [Coregonus sp. 'balchen']
MSRSVKQERVESPAPSCLSMKSDRSKGQDINFSGGACPPDASASLLTEDQFKCSVCSEVLMDLVSIPCGHSYCRQCISTYWAQPGPPGDYVCPQCSKRSRARPVLITNTALETETEEEERENVSKKRKIIEVQEEEEDSYRKISDLKNTISELKKENSELKNLEQENCKLKHDFRELSIKNAALKQEASFEKELMDIRTAALKKMIATLSLDPQQQREAEYVRRNLKNMKMDYG